MHEARAQAPPPLPSSAPALPSNPPQVPPGLGGGSSSASPQNTPRPATGGLPSLQNNPALVQQGQQQAQQQPGVVLPANPQVRSGTGTEPVQFAPRNLPPGVPSRVALPNSPPVEGQQTPPRIDPRTTGQVVPMGQASIATGATPGVATVDMSQLAVLPDGRIVPIDEIPSPEELAFEQVLGSLLPLKPDQIRELRRQIDVTDRAAADPVRPEQPSVSSMEVSLAPGGAPPQIRTGAGRVTALSFYDVTGAPYPVSAVVVGNPDRFQVDAPIPEGNLVTITPLAPYAEGNMVITLLDQPVPILVKLIAGSEVIDYRLDMRIGARGPMASSPIQFVDSSPQVGGPVITGFLDGLPPEGAEPVSVDQPGLSAWRYGDALYLRTRMTLLSPAWSNSAAGAGGLRVYVIPDVPVILASDDGRLISVRVMDQES